MWLDTIAKFVLLEVQMNGQSRVFLPNDDILRGKKVIGVEIYGRDAAGNGKSPLNRPLISAQAVAEAYLTFMCDNSGVLAQMPFSRLVLNPADKRGVLAMELVGISPTKSYLEFADIATISATQSVLLGIYYED